MTTADSVKPVDTTPAVPVSIRWVEELDIPARPEFVACVRRRLVELVQFAGFSSNESTEIAVAVSEAVANAIEHAEPAAGEPTVQVFCTLSPEGLHVRVRDNGKGGWDPGLVPEEADPEQGLDKVQEGGRGLAYMRALTDGVDFNITDSGTEVHLFKRRGS